MPWVQQVLEEQGQSTRWEAVVRLGHRRDFQFQGVQLPTTESDYYGHCLSTGKDPRVFIEFRKDFPSAVGLDH